MTLMLPTIANPVEIAQLPLDGPVERLIIPPKSSHRVTFTDFVTRHYLPFVQTYKRSWPTDRTLLRMHILPAIGHERLNAVPRAAITQLLNRMRQNGYASGTIGRVTALLKYTFRLANRWQFIDAEACPVAELKYPPDVIRNRFLTADEANRLIRVLRSDPNRCAAQAIHLIFLTGARRNEISHAKWENLSVQRRTLLVPRAKNGRPRYVALNDLALQVISEIARVPDNAYIFPSPLTGRPSPSLHFPWRRIRRTAGLPDTLRLHDLRHSFASFLVGRGVSLYVIQQLLGHTHIRTTQRYCHLTPELLQQGVEQLAGALRARQG